jgi:hypothetical protein
MFQQSLAVILNPTVETFEKSLKSPKLWKIFVYFFLLNSVPFLILLANKNVNVWVLVVLLPIFLTAFLIFPSWLYYHVSKKYSSHVDFMKIAYAKALYVLPFMALGVLGGPPRVLLQIIWTTT